MPLKHKHKQDLQCEMARRRQQIAGYVILQRNVRTWSAYRSWEWMR